MIGPQKHASLTSRSFRPVVESLDLTPREAGAIPPVSLDLTAPTFSSRTQWFIGVSVVLHCVVLAAVFGLSRPDALPPSQEIAFEIVLQPPAAPPSVDLRATAALAAPVAPAAAAPATATSPPVAAMAAVPVPVPAQPTKDGALSAASASDAPVAAAPAVVAAAPDSAPPAQPASPDTSRTELARTEEQAAEKIAPDTVAADTPAPDDEGGVTIVARAPEPPTRAAAVEKVVARSGPKLASANPAVSVERAIRLDVPTFVLSPALRARAPEKTAPLGRLAFASAAQIVIGSATDASPDVSAETAAAQTPVAPEPPTADIAPAAVVASAPEPVAPTTPDVPSPAAQISSPLRLPGTDPDITGTLPPAAPDVSKTVFAVAAHEPGASATQIPAMLLGTAAPELVPFPPGPEEEAAARDAAARRAAMARQAEAQRLRRLADLKAATEARARAAKEAKEAREARAARKSESGKAAAVTSRAWRIKVARRIHDFQSYPENVRQRGFEGTVQLSFSVDGSGAVVSKRILKSSGDKELDQEGLDAVQRASPFPAPPPNTSHTFTAPFAYRLR